ncbi:hypothetical Protein YC6258_00771 [Gynuella sunshinyii YC6258]|uniref:Uncharacterized protein n=1 Tax=Gynuella sunshinyii YC6258 TaxID=1445510 RepID=A0A0C5VF89_9GAMM|nr:hypothetical Protein YC6258_00771 [Gynuella sunshinyii YC6258]
MFIVLRSSNKIIILANYLDFGALLKQYPYDVRASQVTH